MCLVDGICVAISIYCFGESINAVRIALKLRAYAAVSK